MPPELDDNDVVSDSSPETDLDATPLGADGDEGQSGADSSDAQGETDGSALGIVRDVVGKREPAEASPATGQEEGASPDQAESGKAEGPDDEDYSDVPFHKHPRFQHLLRKAKSNEADAVRYRNVQNFMDNSGLTSEEVSEGFIVMALAKTEPQKAWERMKPFVQDLLRAAGEVLPDDLNARVQAGELSAEAAREIARANARAQSVEVSRTFEQQRDERKRQQAQIEAVQSAAETWEQDRKAKDPNFEAKKPSLMREIAWLQSTEGKPNTPKGVREQLERAYKAVVPPTPPKAPPAPRVGDGVRRPQPSAANGTSGTAQPAPQSTLDIIHNVVAKRAG